MNTWPTGHSDGVAAPGAGGRGAAGARAPVHAQRGGAPVRGGVAVGAGRRARAGPARAPARPARPALRRAGRPQPRDTQDVRLLTLAFIVSNAILFTFLF